LLVIPAKAGIHFDFAPEQKCQKKKLDSRFRGNDDVGEQGPRA